MRCRVFKLKLHRSLVLEVGARPTMIIAAEVPDRAVFPTPEKVLSLVRGAMGADPAGEAITEAVAKMAYELMEIRTDREGVY